MTVMRYRGGKLMEFKTGSREEANFREEFGGKIRKKRVKVAPAYPYEWEEQAAFVHHVETKLPNVPFFAVPNGTRCHPAQANKNKATGVKPGVPDLVFTLACGTFHGFYLEMKRIKGGHMDPDQKVWLELLAAKGYKTDVAMGCEDAILKLDAYIALGPFKWRR